MVQLILPEVQDYLLANCSVYHIWHYEQFTLKNNFFSFLKELTEFQNISNQKITNILYDKENISQEQQLFRQIHGYQNEPIIVNNKYDSNIFKLLLNKLTIMYGSFDLLEKHKDEFQKHAENTHGIEILSPIYIRLFTNPIKIIFFLIIHGVITHKKIKENKKYIRESFNILCEISHYLQRKCITEIKEYNIKDLNTQISTLKFNNSLLKSLLFILFHALEPLVIFLFKDIINQRVKYNQIINKYLEKNKNFPINNSFEFVICKELKYILYSNKLFELINKNNYIAIKEIFYNQLYHFIYHILNNFTIYQINFKLEINETLTKLLKKHNLNAIVNDIFDKFLLCQNHCLKKLFDDLSSNIPEFKNILDILSFIECISQEVHSLIIHVLQNIPKISDDIIFNLNNTQILQLIFNKKNLVSCKDFQLKNIPPLNDLKYIKQSYCEKYFKD